MLLFWSLVCIAGALGGVLTTLVTSDTVMLPRRVEDTTWQLGIIGNVIVGAAAAAASWGLYSPYSQASVLAIAPTTASPTVSALTMAFLTGIGGTKWLNSETQSDLWQATAAKAAATSVDSAKAAQVLTSSATAAFIDNPVD